MLSQLKDQIKFIRNNHFHPKLSTLTGNILEIGFGKGDSFKHYRQDSNVHAIDLNTLEFDKQADHSNLSIFQGNAENLPFPDDYFDSLVFSFVLCSVDSVDAVINEINRVVKRGGTIIALEHVKSNKRFIVFFQKLITAIQRTVGMKCHLDRDPRSAWKSYNFKTITEVEFHNSLEPYLYIELEKM
jgi:ubiquinone/menaquinone biosynthesis C-methylase UbiE